MPAEQFRYVSDELAERDYSAGSRQLSSAQRGTRRQLPSRITGMPCDATALAS